MDRNTKRAMWAGLACTSAVFIVGRRYYLSTKQLVGLTVGGSITGGSMAYAFEQLQNK